MSESIQARLRRFGIWSAIPLLIAGCADPYADAYPYSDNYYTPRNRVSTGVVVQSGGYYREPYWGRNDHRPRPGGWNRPDRGDNDDRPGRDPGRNPGHNSGPKPGSGGGHQGGQRPSTVWVPPQNNKATGERRGASWLNKPAQSNASSDERRGASWQRDNRRVLPEDQ